jgi:hypothetical protein
MKNLSVQIPFDQVRLDALNYFLEQKNVFLEDEVEAFLLNLYKRAVPKNLQPYYDDMAAKAAKPPAQRPAKPRADSDT